LPDPTDPDHLARLTFRALDVEAAHVALAEAILERHSDRRWYSAERVPEELLTDLLRAAEHQGARAAKLTRPGFRVGLSDVLRTARLQNWDPRYLEELDRVTNRFQTEQTGIPAANRTAASGHLNRDFPAGTLADPAPDGPERAELLVLGAEAAGPLGALIAGEACSAVLLGATAVGLASCVLSQPLESASARRRIKAMLDEPMEPLLLVRLGWPNSAEPIPPTPRRPLAEVLTAGPKVTDGGDFRSMPGAPVRS
jgi:nitroreductase